jgi:hypothetical protein
MAPPSSKACQLTQSHHHTLHSNQILASTASMFWNAGTAGGFGGSRERPRCQGKTKDGQLCNKLLAPRNRSNLCNTHRGQVLPATASQPTPAAAASSSSAPAYQVRLVRSRPPTPLCPSPSSFPDHQVGPEPTIIPFHLSFTSTCRGSGSSSRGSGSSSSSTTGPPRPRPRPRPPPPPPPPHTTRSVPFARPPPHSSSFPSASSRRTRTPP